ncbi:MAG: membrane protein insertase YidC [Candidatus Stahlbacteria bacterium]|nr:membrane protein insertase YidC [Candidatus Stahlbacteria bacterium]
MDKRPYIGIALIFFILVMWTMTITNNARKQVKPIPHSQAPQSVINNTPKATPQFTADTIELSLDTVDTKVAQIIVSRIGGTIKAVNLKHYKSPNSKSVELIPENARTLGGAMGEINLSNARVELIDRTPLSLVYEFKDTLLPAGINKTYSFKDSSYTFEVAIDLPEPSKYKIQWDAGLRTTEKNAEMEVRYFGGIVKSGGTVTVKGLNSLDTLPKGEPGTIEWVGVKNKYFLSAIVPGVETENYSLNKATFTRVGGGCMSGCMPTGAINQEDIKVSASLTTQASKRHKFKLYVGPLDYDILKRTGSGLEDACYFGFKWIRPISRLFLKVLTGLHKVVPNYGVVIIIFSFLLSMMFFPLTKMSQKSMIEMQKLQPKLQELQKKYAKEPKHLNQATMELYRKHGVSPFSGCLPMLIQMPIFFALYALLDTTIALRGAVFIPHWIEDLSQHDPFFALPIVMGVMMFLQQKLQGKASSGSSQQMQQQQKMMMYFMPVMFTVIFLKFPAGLVLYWFVYNIFSFAQTYTLMKTKGF